MLQMMNLGFLVGRVLNRKGTWPMICKRVSPEQTAVFVFRQQFIPRPQHRERGLVSA